MSKYFQWWLLYAVTGRPVLAIALLVILWWSADRFTIRILPDPLQGFFRWRRIRQLRNTIHLNPHDRRARFELAELLIDQRRYGAAVDVLKPNLEADHDDAGTLYVMGVACLGSQRADQGEVFLDAARAIDPTFRMNAIDLELGRWRLARGDTAKAREPLERFCAHRHGTVEGKVLLARALEAQGDQAGAARVRDAAWADYVSSPRFQRRKERFWAWRARPSRPLTYVAIALAVGLLFARVGAPYIEQAVRGHNAMAAERDEEE